MYIASVRRAKDSLGAADEQAQTGSRESGISLHGGALTVLQSAMPAPAAAAASFDTA